MVGVGTPVGRIARSAQALVYAVVMAVVGALAWRTSNLQLPDVGQFAGIIGSGVLGGIVNPGRVKPGGAAADPAASVAPGTPAAAATPAGAANPSDANSAAAATPGTGADSAAAANPAGSANPAVGATAYELPWLIAVLIGGAAIIVCALALAFDAPRHVNAAPALTVLVTAFGALFIDTSKITHGLIGATPANGDGGGS